jgi:hypothetical protein
MKTEVLLRSIGKINDELIADAESEANTKRKPGWAKLGTILSYREYRAFWVASFSVIRRRLHDRE